MGSNTHSEGTLATAVALVILAFLGASLLELVESGWWATAGAIGLLLVAGREAGEWLVARDRRTQGVVVALAVAMVACVHSVAIQRRPEHAGQG